MADKESLFNKYKTVDLNGEEKIKAKPDPDWMTGVSDPDVAPVVEVKPKSQKFARVQEEIYAGVPEVVEEQPEAPEIPEESVPESVEDFVPMEAPVAEKVIPVEKANVQEDVVEEQPVEAEEFIDFVTDEQLVEEISEEPVFEELFMEASEEITPTPEEPPVIEEPDPSKEMIFVFDSQDLEPENTPEPEQIPVPVPVVAPVVEKKVKEPKPPKEKKVKEPKPPKEKKVKPPKEKKAKEPKPQKEKDEKVPLSEIITNKDMVTIGLALLALILALVFVVVKYILPEASQPETPVESSTEANSSFSDVQVTRDGLLMHLVQSDIENIFYGFSTTYDLQYYQYRDNKMTPVKATGSVTTEVDMGNEKVPVTIEYVQVGDRIFGIGLFRGDQNPGVYFYKQVVFKLTNLPKGYDSGNKALLLATTSKDPITSKVDLWPESFVVDLSSGASSRFLSIVNRGIDVTTGGYVTNFCVLSDEGYSSTNGKVPFMTAREYDGNSNKRDIFIKSGASETLFASNVYGNFLLTDGNGVIFMRTNGTGFDVIRKENGKETKVVTLTGNPGTSFITDEEYVLDVINGKLHNLKTGKEISMVGYRITPQLFSVSPDGKYAVVLGTVNSIMDYQIHIYNLETGEYAKYEDQNFTKHLSVTFIDDHTVIYTVPDPNQGYEYVILDCDKAFK